MTKQLKEGFKRSVYWNEYKSKLKTKEADANNLKRFPLDGSFQEVETFIINQLMIKSKIMMKLEILQQEKEMVTQLVAY